MGLAGCVGTAEEEAPAAETKAPQAENLTGSLAVLPPENVTRPLAATPLSYQGTAEASACPVAMGSGPCFGLVNGENVLYPLDVPGVLTAVRANLTWSGATQLQEPFTAMLLRQVEGNWEWAEGNLSAEGTSPIVIDWTLPNPIPGAQYALYVQNYQWLFVAGNGLAWGVPQDFAVEGVLLSTPA
ncbi:MAG TPA: hypothetical protein VNZ52_01600 [Candidatus Thermoplasmatota archaeon]|nr:hypothetical protein [Candidatus Thermoplasmatota archaeon]